MTAWGPLTFRNTNNQSIDVMQIFSANVVNGLNGNNTLGNETFLYKAVVKGSIVANSPLSINS